VTTNRSHQIAKPGTATGRIRAAAIEALEIEGVEVVTPERLKIRQALRR
jgi:hypothetical protein